MKNLWKAISSPRKFTLISGPCVIEQTQTCFAIAHELQKLCKKLSISFVFKASYDKANRTSSDSYRGPGVEAGLEILKELKEYFKIPITTDVHSVLDVAEVATVADIIQIPAFLCRQTDLIEAAVRTGRIVNIKKGQFLSPYDMGQVIFKARSAGGQKLIVTERGTTFGYNNLVVDMRSIAIMKKFGVPVFFDATHSVQLPGGSGVCSSGQREFAPVLARCAVAAGADGLFVETHPDPDKALSDGPNMVPLNEMEAMLKNL